MSEDDARKMLNSTYGITCSAIEFANDIRFQNENRRVLQSGNARNIIYRLGRTEERYDGAIRTYDAMTSIATRVKNAKAPVTAPIMEIASRQEYAVCLNCHKSVMVSVPWQDYYWQFQPAPVKCNDCHNLSILTDKILLFSAMQKATEKGVEKAVEKGVDWLARQFGNDADEVLKTYYFEMRR